MHVPYNLTHVLEEGKNVYKFTVRVPNEKKTELIFFNNASFFNNVHVSYSIIRYNLLNMVLITREVLNFR